MFGFLFSDSQLFLLFALLFVEAGWHTKRTEKEYFSRSSSFTAVRQTLLSFLPRSHSSRFLPRSVVAPLDLSSISRFCRTNPRQSFSHFYRSPTTGRTRPFCFRLVLQRSSHRAHTTLFDRRLRCVAVVLFVEAGRFLLSVLLFLPHP